MINPNWEVIDLDPVTWRNIGRFLDPSTYIRSAQPGEHGLFVLHDAGKVIRVYDTQQGLRQGLVPSMISSPRDLAETLYARKEWQRVHIIDKNHLADVDRQVQATTRRELDLDEYYHFVYELIWSNPDGYLSVPAHPGHWNGWTYKGLRDFVERLPPHSSLALGVFDPAGNIAIGLIGEIKGSQIVRLTTFEALDLAFPGVGGHSGEGVGLLSLSEETTNFVWKALGEKFAPPAALLLCTQDVFDAWIEKENKVAIIEAAIQEKKAFLCCPALDFLPPFNIGASPI